MDSTIYKKITYRELKDTNPIAGLDDRYGIGAFVVNNISKCFLNSPYIEPEATAAILAIENNTIVGRHVFYGTNISINEVIINAFSTGSTEVHISQRGKGIGSRINRITLDNKDYKMYLFSLVTPAYISILSKKENKCTIFNIPQLIKLHNTKYTFQCRGISGKLLSVCTAVGNGLLWLYNFKNRLRLRQLEKRYYIKRLTKVPDWAGDMCTKNTFKYFECHNTEWLQWNLDNNLSGIPRDIQSFYAIYRESIPVGFFMTKERVRRDVPNCPNMVCGTVCEWATTDNDLTEADINVLSIPTFSNECYHILTVTNDNVTYRNLRKLGFISYGSMQMGFQDKGLLDKFPDMTDINNWRIRFGCCNSILY